MAQEFHENIVSADEAGTLDGLFASRIRRSPDSPAYKGFDRKSKSWLSYSWSEMGAKVALWQQALAAENLQKGDRVAVLLRNCPEWVMFDQAVLSLGLVTVPLYTDDRPDNAAYILGDAAVKLLLVQDAGRWKHLISALEEGGALERVVILDDSDEASALAATDDRLEIAANWLQAKGAEYQAGDARDPKSLASIVYTSGTTGRPKGVMLSHHNMLSVAHSCLIVADVYEEDLFLSFLPLSHTLERTAGYYLPMMAGSCVAYARSIAQLGDDLQQIKPTVIISVPRVFERVYGKIRDQLQKKGAVALGLFNMAVSVGWQRFLHRQGRAEWRLKQLLWPLLNKLVAQKIVDRLGGRMRAAVSGGAALPADISRIFIGLGVPIIQGYGLTETSPVVSANSLEDNVPASVGKVVRGVDVKIGSNDELLVSGVGVMLGYWNNHKATAEMIDSDGWLHTGDQARIENGHIFITGRLKDILVLSNGEKVPPADMESAIVMDPYVEQVMVVGEGRPYLSALVVLNAETWPKLAQDEGLDPLRAETIQDQRVLAAVLRRIRAALSDFPGYAKIRRISLTLEPWTVESGLLTPTMKVKRAKVSEHMAQQIESMYKGGPAS